MFPRRVLDYASPPKADLTLLRGRWHFSIFAAGLCGGVLSWVCLPPKSILSLLWLPGAVYGLALTIALLLSGSRRLALVGLIPLSTIGYFFALRIMGVASSFPGGSLAASGMVGAV